MYRFGRKLAGKMNDMYWATLRKIKGRQAIDRSNRKRIRNTDVSIIASNCNGGIISHDLGLQFRSPFVNLWIEPGDFVKLLSNLEEYLQCDLVFITAGDIPYPVALLKDVKIYFQHYKTEEEAESDWKKRRSRINYHNLAIVFTDRDGCTYQMLREFDALPYPRKVVFTHRTYHELKSAYCFECFAEEKEVGVLSDYKNDKLQIRYLDEFDYVTFLNEGYSR